MEITSIEQNLLSLMLDKLIEFTLLHSNLYKIPESSAALFTSRPVAQELKSQVPQSHWDGAEQPPCNGMHES